MAGAQAAPGCSCTSGRPFDLAEAGVAGLAGQQGGGDEPERKAFHSVLRNKSLTRGLPQALQRNPAVWAMDAYNW